MPDINPRVRFHITMQPVTGWREPKRLLYDCELVHVQQGEFHLRIEDREVLMRPGAIAIIGPGIDHESWTDPDKSVVRQCLHFDWTAEHAHIRSPLFCPAGEDFDPACLHPPDPAFESCLPLISTPRQNAPILPIVRDLFDRLREGDAIGETLLYPVLHFLLGLQTRRQPQRIGSKSDRAIYELKQYIDSHYREPLMLEQFCALTRLSPSHLCQAFRQRVGMPPGKYLNHVRLEHATRLLTTSSMNVGEVARAVGFADSNYFTRYFKRKRGKSPGAYVRDQNG